MSLLHEATTTTIGDNNGCCKVSKMAEEDDNASQYVFISQEKYFYIEYMDWMGKDVFDIQKELGLLL